MTNKFGTADDRGRRNASNLNHLEVVYPQFHKFLGLEKGGEEGGVFITSVDQLRKQSEVRSGFC